MTMQKDFLCQMVFAQEEQGGKKAKQLKTAIVSLKTADTSLSNTCHTGPLTFDD